MYLYLTLKIFLYLLLGLIGLYFYTKQVIVGTEESVGAEGFTLNTACPNLLVQKGDKIYLYNSNKVQVPSINPLIFDNLEEYTEYLDWQRSKNIRCPVLYMRQMFDTQGQNVYKVLPSITEPQAGLNAISTTQSQQPPQQQQPQLPPNLEYDPDMANAMSDKWAGAEYTQKMVDAGMFAGNEVSKSGY